MKRSLFASALLLLSANLWAQDLSAVLYKDPSCGCCGAYADYLEEQGFTVQRIDSNNMDAIKAKLGTSQAASCHTMKIGNYVVEGHVPVAAIHKMLDEKPAILGISIPGMPMNSPGMGPEKKGSLEVLSLDQDGKVIGLYQRL